MKDPRLSIIFLAIGVALLVTGAVLKVTHDQQVANSRPVEVKEQTIPMSIEDFEGDSHLQGAIQQQLQQQQGSVQTTEGNGTSGDSELLQPVPKGLQSEGQ
jgi:hypothetical protein